MFKSWALRIGSLAGLVLALGGRAQCATSLSIELPKGANAGAAAPAVVTIGGLPIPAGGATVSVDATTCYSPVPAHLTTLYVVGSGIGGPVNRDMRAAIGASPDVLTAIQNDPSAKLTLTVCSNGGRTCTTSTPYPALFHR